MASRLKGFDLNCEASVFEANQECSLSSINETPASDGSGGFVNGGTMVLGGVNDSSSKEVLKPKMDSVNGGELGMAGMPNGNCGLNLGTKGGDKMEVDHDKDVNGNCGLNLGTTGGDKMEVDHGKDTRMFPQVSNLSGINLVVDLNSCIQDGGYKEVKENGGSSNAVGVDVYPGALIPKRRAKGNQPEKEGEFHVSDLVWGKVRSHPWWPGQIIEPSAASAKAMRHIKKDSYLIAYFGDQSFAWNEASKIKPFGLHFSQMSKQSGGEAFCEAVNAALEEYSRRVQVGLACACLPEEALGKVKLLSLKNDGVRDVYGGDSFATADSFHPEEIVSFIQTLAKSPQAGCDAVEFFTAKARLSAFYRRKGYYELPGIVALNGDLGEDSGLHDASLNAELGDGLHVLHKEDDLDHMIDVDVDSGDDYIAAYGKRKSPSTQSDLGLGEAKKPRVDLKLGSSLSLQNGENESEAKAENQKEPATSASAVKADSQKEPATSASAVKADSQKEPVISVSEVKADSQKKAAISVSEVKGDSQKEPAISVSEVKADSQKEPAISVPVRRGRGRPRKVAVENAEPEAKKSQLDFNSGSSSSFQNGSEGKADSQIEPANSAPVRRGRGRPRKTPAPKPYESAVSSLTGEKCPARELLSKLCAAAASPMEDGYHILASVAGVFCNFRNSVSLEGGKNNDKMPSSEKPELEAVELEALEDSYWTDRVIQPETTKAADKVASEAYEEYKKAHAAKEAADKAAYEAYEEYKKARAAKEAAEGYCPTALIFKFSNLDSLPSVTNLNEIYGRFGPLEESRTKVLHKSKCLRFVFKKKSDAERAFSTSGKYAIFGPALDSYWLDFEPSTSKSSSAKRRRSK